MSSVLLLDRTFFAQGKVLDATRFGFISDLQKYHKVIFFNNSAFEVAALEQTDDIIYALSINAAYLDSESMAFLKSRNIPVIVWYYDAISICHPEEVKNAKQADHVFYSCTSFIPLVEKGRDNWLPFAAQKRVLADRSRLPSDDSIGFMGTLWNFNRVNAFMSLGATNANLNGKILSDAALINYVRSNLCDNIDWYGGDIKFRNNDLLNCLSSHRRVEILSFFSDKNLKIYGDYYWPIGLWHKNPSLIEKWRPLKVVSSEQMATFVTNHAVSLNIFHEQNRNGGPNFRILDSAAYGGAILSDYNSDCERLFPENVAALYFKDSREAFEKSNELVKSADLRERLVRNANEAFLECHTNDIRIAFLASTVNHKIVESKLKPIKIFSSTLDKKIFGATYDYAKLSEFTESEKSYFIENELYHLNLMLIGNKNRPLKVLVLSILHPKVISILLKLKKAILACKQVVNKFKASGFIGK